MRVEQTSRFKRDLKREKKGRYKKSIQDDLYEILDILTSVQVIPSHYCDHALAGSRKGFRDCHIKPDLVLIYRLTPDALHLVRLGSHSELGFQPNIFAIATLTARLDEAHAQNARMEALIESALKNYNMGEAA